MLNQICPNLCPKFRIFGHNPEKNVNFAPICDISPITQIQTSTIAIASNRSKLLLEGIIRSIYRKNSHYYENKLIKLAVEDPLDLTKYIDLSVEYENFRSFRANTGKILFVERYRNVSILEVKVS